MNAAESLGPALRLAPDNSGCGLVFTEAVLSEPTPRVFVVYTDPESTLVALRAAGTWANQLNFGIDLVVPHVVPYPLAVSTPSVPMEFTQAKIGRLLAASGVDADVHVYLCRDAYRALSGVLPAHSTVVIGGGKSWLPVSAKRLARKLKKLGHLVIAA